MPSEQNAVRAEPESRATEPGGRATEPETSSDEARSLAAESRSRTAEAGTRTAARESGAADAESGAAGTENRSADAENRSADAESGAAGTENRSAGENPVAAALENLADFHRRRLTLSPAALIETFIEDRLLVAAAFGEPRPREAWRRLRYVVSRARAFTGPGRHSLRAFLDWIESLQRADVRDPEAGSIESDEDAIHIQTIHGAKGLEFPIVFLAGLGTPSRWRSAAVDVLLNRDTQTLACRLGQSWETPDYAEVASRERELARAEAVRLLYVAATRARDHLILSLHRGPRSDDSAAAVIERYLEDAPTGLCPIVAPPEPTQHANETPPHPPAPQPAPAGQLALAGHLVTAQHPAPVIDSTSESEVERAWLAARTLRTAAATAVAREPSA